MTNRPMQPGDEPGMLEVLTSAFHGWPRFEIAAGSLEHLRWQLQGYLPRENAHFVAEVDGRIAALDMGYIRGFKVKGQDLDIWVGTDGATHADFQGKGIYSKVRRYRQDVTRPLFDFMLSQTTNPVISRLYGVQGDRVAWGNRITMLLRILDAGQLARTPGSSSRGLRGNLWLRRAAFGAGQLWGGLRPRLRRPGNRSWQIGRCERFDQRFDDLWRAAAAGFDLIGERGAAFLNWRYADPRAGGHVVLVAEEAGAVLGYVVVRTSRGRGSIVDLLTLPGREDVVDSLVEEAIRHCRRAGCSAVQFTTVARHPYNRVLGTHGFFDGRRGTDFYCGAMRTPPDKLRFLEAKTASVHLTDGDMI